MSASRTYLIENTPTCTACGAVLPIDTDGASSTNECPHATCRRVNGANEVLR